jgi:hypothetical protein
MKAFIAVRLANPKEKDFVKIFELLEEIARLQRDHSFLETLQSKPKQELKTPVFIIREIQRLDDLHDNPELGRMVFKRLFEYFEPYKQRQMRVPVIVESPLYLYSRLKQILSSQESFRGNPVGPWQKEEAESWLVNKNLRGQTSPS